MLFTRTAPAIVGCVAAISLLTTACATKKFVRETVAPVQTHVGAVEKKTGDNTTAIGDLDRNVARVDEKAMEADKKAVAAAQAADRANQAASHAQESANSASTLAQQGIAKAGAVDTRVTNLVSNFDAYQLSATEKIYFAVSRSELANDEKAKLDQAIQNLQNAKNYVIEVAGYADKTGNRVYNLELSRRRADAVVRYLTIDHQIPLRRIRDIGAGAEFPNADNATREARKENRRVDVKVYTFSGEAAK
jgi:outer membrane protein OmpA-like peptidoglycan-associated protein